MHRILGALDAMGIEYSAHQPSDFIVTHTHQLLPDWGVPVASVLIIMQRSQVYLCDRTQLTETEKNMLRQRFITWGKRIAEQLAALGHLAEIFDPRTGTPIRSQAGLLTLDDVAVVRAHLHYPLVETGGCWILEHPRWGTAVFPAVLLSSAPINLLLKITDASLNSETINSPG